MAEADSNEIAEAAGQPDGDTQDHPGPLLRGRMMLAAGAVALGVIAAVVIVSLDGPGDATGEADGVQIAADETVAPDAGDPATDGSFTPAGSDGAFDVVLEPGDDGLLHLRVDDPATPVTSDSPAQHCALVTLSGPTSVEGYACLSPADGAPGEIRLSEPGAPLVGCAAVATRGPRGDVASVGASSEFDLTDGGALPPGTYDVKVVVITGVGDGCPPADDGGTEREATATGSLRLG